MLGIPIGLVVGNAIEYTVHRYFHKAGRKKSSMWSFHWHEHHKNCRKTDHIDPDYEKRLFQGWDAQTKEAVSLAAGAVALAPLGIPFPFFYGTLVYGAVDYYRKHKKSHQDGEWAREHLPWHYDHHMGPDQEKNWCVTRPWMDNWMGTREPYVGTEREKQDIEKRERLRKRRAAEAAKKVELKAA
jgi:hypothetical protein